MISYIEVIPNMECLNKISIYGNFVGVIDSI